MKMSLLMVIKLNLHFLYRNIFFDLAEASLNDIISEYQQISNYEPVDQMIDSLSK